MDSGGTTTVTEQDADIPLLSVPVIVVVPADFPVTTPLETDATFVLDEVQLIFVSVAFEGWMVYDIV